MDMDVFQNPMKAKGKVTVDMGDLGGKQETEMYMQETDGEAFVYVGMNGQWVKQAAACRRHGNVRRTGYHGFIS